MKLLGPRNNRGVALLIVLLVTALLIALVFEFAYATRISLNSAVNFRDSQRAYFLALTGINAFKSNGEQLRKLIPAGEEQVVPLNVETDTNILIKWEDESGKIRISDVKINNATREVARRLFENVKRIDTHVLDKMTADGSSIGTLTLLSGLHQFMTNEDYWKVADSLTAAPVSTNKLNINTASRDVLQALGLSEYDADSIIKDRKTTPYSQQDLSSTGRLSRLQSYFIQNLNLFSYVVAQSEGYYKVTAKATVGGYTKVVEAVLQGNTVIYWKAL